MLILVTGGSGSGKSEYAENEAQKLSAEKKFYIATMIPWDDECRERIERHRKMRQMKSFETIECYRNIDKISLEEEAEVILLECMSNLAANEMFSGEDFSVEKIIKGINHIAAISKHVIVVTNEVFSDGIVYDEETRKYQEFLGEINCRLAMMADKIVEVVCGIELVIKGADAKWIY